MAHVEIYKLKETVHPQVRDFSVFDYMDKGVAPDPMHYVKEWAGEMHGTLPLTIPGRLMLEPPPGYRGGEINNGDIAVVNGAAYFMDRYQGSKFIEIDSFDAGSARQAQHPKYGWFVDANGAEAISDELAAVCVDLHIPVGYLGEQSRGGAYSGNRPFLPGASDGAHLDFLHPDFMKGEEAREFICLLTELSGAEQWHNISAYLYERYPINMDDLRQARDRFAPELLLPAELRPLAKHIPIDADQSELAYLSAKIIGMDDEQRNVFYAVIEGGLHYGGSVATFINITENLDCFDLESAALDESMYGAFRLESDWDICEAAINRLEKSEDPSDRFLVKHIMLLNRCADDETYGHHAMKDDGGAFTSRGYITQGRPLEDKYRGLQDIPAECRSPAVPMTSAPEPVIKPVMVHNTDLAALLLEMHAVGGDYMRDAAHNIKALANKGDDFFIMANAGMLIVAPVDLVFRRDTHEFEMWMTAYKSPDVRTFVMSVTGRDGGRITGNLFEADLYDLQDYVRENSFFFTHLDAEMKGGAARRFTLEEWDAMDQFDRSQLKSRAKHYDPADEGKLAAYLSVLRRAAPENRQPVAAGEFLSEINRQFMERASNPQPDMLRVAPEAAKEILAQSAADVFRLMPNDMEKLSPIDAIKVGQYSAGNEFAVRRCDWAGIEKWAQMASGDILRQNERGQRDKSKHNGAEL